MKYFCSIAGVPAEGGMGFVSVRVPNNVSYVRYDGGGGDGKGQHGQFLNINIKKSRLCTFLYIIYFYNITSL